MHKRKPHTPDRDREQRFGGTVDKKAARKLRARRERERTVWSWLGMMGLVGWSVAIPTLLGIFVGLWLDERTEGDRISWTLTFLIVGVALGCWQAWYWVKRESRDE